MLVSANIPRLGIKGREAITNASETPPIVNILAIFVLDIQSLLLKYHISLKLK